MRGDIHRMHHEFNQAYQQYRGAAEAFQPVARFHQMAQQHGTTLEKALDNYTGIEAKLRKDVVAGLDSIVNNLGLTDPQTGQRIGLRDIAYHVLSQSPEQLQQVQMGNQQMAASHQIGGANQRIERLENEHLTDAVLRSSSLIRGLRLISSLNNIRVLTRKNLEKSSSRKSN